jgi:hypothetical protein
VKRIFITAGILVASLSLTGCAGVLAQLSGEVQMDPSIIEQNIIDKYSEDGITVTVDCPDPFSAKPGDSRNCLVTDDAGNTAMAVVTVENREGTFTWVVE